MTGRRTCSGHEMWLMGCVIAAASKLQITWQDDMQVCSMLQHQAAWITLTQDMDRLAGSLSGDHILL